MTRTTPRQQVLALLLLTVVVLPLGLPAFLDDTQIGPLEAIIWLALVLVLAVAIFTWGRGTRSGRR